MKSIFHLTLIVVALGLTNIIHAQDGPIKTGQDYADFWIEVINEGRSDLISKKYLAEDAELHIGSNKMTGLNPIRAYYQAFFDGFSDIKFSVKDIIGEGDKLVKHWRFEGVHSGTFHGIPATGKSLALDGTTLIELENGRIKKEQEFYDNHSFLMQLGLLSDPNNSSVIKGLYDNFATGNVEAVLAALDDNIVWNEAEDFELAGGNPYVGPKAVLEGVFMPIGKNYEYWSLKNIELHPMDGNKVLATLRYDAKRKDNGAVIDAQTAHLWTLESGKVTAFQQYTNTLHVAKAAEQ